MADQISKVRALTWQGEQSFEMTGKYLQADQIRRVVFGSGSYFDIPPDAIVRVEAVPVAPPPAPPAPPPTKEEADAKRADLEERNARTKDMLAERRAQRAAEDEKKSPRSGKNGATPKKKKKT